MIDTKTGQIQYKIGSENFYTRQEFDPAGRLVKVYVETESGERLVSETRHDFVKGL